MADIVLGIGTSHGPLLSTPPEQWHQRAEADRRNQHLWYRGSTWTFGELLAERGGPDAFTKELELSVRQERAAACRRAIALLGKTIAEASPDVLVIVTDDQKEMFGDELLPTFGVYYGDEAAHLPIPPERLATMQPGLAIAASGHVPDKPTIVACVPELGLHLIDSLINDGFDVATSRQLPPGRHGDHSIPHGYGFVYKSVLTKPIPMVPVFVNSFYAPNQPTAARCYAFGQALRRAVATWPDARTVAFVASGGMTHFVVEEDFDRAFLDALRSEDSEYLSAIGQSRLQSGTSEMRNWIVTGGALAGSGLTMDLLDYVPCYRSEAGTGNGMAFAVWR